MTVTLSMMILHNYKIIEAIGAMYRHVLKSYPSKTQAQELFCGIEWQASADAAAPPYTFNLEGISLFVHNSKLVHLQLVNAQRQQKAQN